MPPLIPTQRRDLEKVVLSAREAAERGARAALERLAVHHHEPYPSMSPDDRRLRKRLRARGRTLGDERNEAKGTQAIDRLTVECAYEQWHRMLFTRILAECHLLVHPEHGVSVTLDECADLAAEEGATDAWALATRYASRMLPAIFRPDDPLLTVELAPEHRQELERLLASLTPAILTADDVLGWVYQYWQAAEKEAVNASGCKIGARELPAVTQLFTEHYMVLFLLHNTIGAWRAGKLRADSGDPGAGGTPTGAESGEDEMRQLVALPDYEFDSLRFTAEGRPAAGVFAEWPRHARELRVLDPCCGSGHFLVAAFDLLARLRMEEEGLSPREAADAVVRENLFGLELDPRCAQIAAFALALAAWRFPGSGGYWSLKPGDLNIACSGQGIYARKEDWLALLREAGTVAAPPHEGKTPCGGKPPNGGTAGTENGAAWLSKELGRLYEKFQQAATLGSLVDPTPVRELFESSRSRLRPVLEQAFRREVGRGSLDAAGEEREALGVAARGIAHATEILSGRYHLVVTNVPYLARGKQCDTLKEFCERDYPEAKTDLATVFTRRSLQLCTPAGTAALVTPQNWLFLKGYRKMRERVLREERCEFVARLGPGAFETITGEVVNVALVILSHLAPGEEHALHGLDASAWRTVQEKATSLRGGLLQKADQERQLGNPDSLISLEDVRQMNLLREYATALSGCSAGDSPRFTRSFWEVLAFTDGTWRFHHSTVSETVSFGGQSEAIFWERESGSMCELAQSVRHLNHAAQNWLRGKPNWGKQGVVVSQMGDLPCALYTGEIYDCNCCAIVPNDPYDSAALWAYCESGEFARQVRKIDQSLKVTPQALLNVPFDLPHWQQVAADRYPNGLPEPYSEDPTQWIFKGRPFPSTAPLHVAAARLLGYRWPDQGADDLDDLADDDGVVCIPAVGGERPAADRLRELLARAVGGSWSSAREAELLAAAGHGGKTLEEWVRNGFFEDHCRIFHQRPFLWHVWDGRRDGFGAIVNYHRLDRRLLERLAYTYLGDWLARVEHAAAQGEAGAESRLVAARGLQDRLRLILEGEPPHDIFVRWKPIEKQPIGWEPDLDDGVRVNIRPFVEADVLRKRPNIKWGVDRGKNPAGAPWGEVRDNDRHLSPAQKRPNSER